jgi:hypothetical protein
VNGFDRLVARCRLWLREPPTFRSTLEHADAPLDDPVSGYTFPAAWHGKRWRTGQVNADNEPSPRGDKWLALDADGRVREIVDRDVSRVRPYVGTYIFPQKCIICGLWMSNRDAVPENGMCPACAEALG